jgi:acetyl-CoA carboxylase biotin carboxyl carrier protein
MTIKEIQDLIKLMDKSSLTEFSYEVEGLKLKIKGQQAGQQTFVTAPVAPQPILATAPVAVPAQSVTPVTTPEPAAPAASTPQETPKSANLIEIKSPMVGTFYRSSSPDKPAFVNVGDSINVGSVLCIIEAMKLFNEIEAEVGGKIAKVMVEDASPVEYDQVLFLVEA